MFSFFHPQTNAKIYMATSSMFFLLAGLVNTVMSSDTRSESCHKDADRCEALIDAAFLQEVKLKAICLSLVGNFLSSWACMEPHSRYEVARDLRNHDACEKYIDSEYPEKPRGWAPSPQPWGLR